jgi:hypothetical protein
MENLVFQIKGTAQTVFKNIALALRVGVYWYLIGRM